MVAQRDIQLAEEVLEELRARGDREKATALENIILPRRPRSLFRQTLDQAATSQ